MAKTKFTITVRSTRESLTQTVNIHEPEFINGYWTTDEQGEQPLKEARLGDTVYFHVETKGIANGQEITLKLYEQDKNICMIDFFDPDDEKFPEEEVVKNAYVNDGKATVELVLQDKWEGMIVDDHDNWVSVDQKLELYWLVSYGKREKELPLEDEDYLRVSYGERNLYFKTPLASSYNLPELLANDGSPLLMMKFGKSLTIGELKKSGIKFAETHANEAITNIALTKLEKGYLATNTGKVIQKSKVYTRDVFSNDGTLIKDAKIAANSGYRTPQGVITTKGINQFEYFSKNGSVKVKVLGFVKRIGTAFDIFGFAKLLHGVADKGIDTSKPLPLNLGPLTPIWDLAGVMVSDHKAEFDMMLEEHVQNEIDAAKQEGLEATRAVVEKWKHSKEYQWDILGVSAVTANKLINGEFKTFDELAKSRTEDRDLYSNVHILYRKKESVYRKMFNNYIIEAVFIDE